MVLINNILEQIFNIEAYFIILNFDVDTFILYMVFM
jgi:hypothetical protein